MTHILALIPARGGSKGIPRKNIRNFAGHPLIAWSIAAGLQANSVSRVIVSTDDEEIAEVAVPHLGSAPRPVVSFGQGCEGEPLLQAPLLEEAIRLIRRKTFAGTINLNTTSTRRANAIAFDVREAGRNVVENGVKVNKPGRTYESGGRNLRNQPAKTAGYQYPEDPEGRREDLRGAGLRGI